MIKWVKSKLSLKTDLSSNMEYENCIRDLIRHETVASMKNYKQHGDINCLEHCLFVSYYSYLVCRRLGFDYRSAARGGLLHDLFLYDWHTTKPELGLHGFVHPLIALQNSSRYFNLNEIEKDIILKHMWPLTLRLPRFRESCVVMLVDKYCAFMETVGRNSRNSACRLPQFTGR